MIQNIRIDDRLLHGQVAYSWKSALGYEAIVIVSEDAAANPIRTQALKLAKPDGVKLAVRTIDGAITMLSDARLKDTKVFVVTDTVESALRMYTALEENPTVTLGGIQSKEGKKLFAPAVYLTNEDVEMLDQLVAQGANLEIKQVPVDKTKDYQDLKKKFVTE